MPITSTDIQFRLSGGSANSDPDSSLGGVKSSEQVTNATANNLFDDVTGNESSLSNIDYRCIYIHNAHATLSLPNAVLWVSTNTTSVDDEIDLVLAREGLNGTATAITNETTAPANVTFSHPATKAGGLSLGSIPAGQHYGVWLKRTVNASAKAIKTNSYVITVETDSLIRNQLEIIYGIASFNPVIHCKERTLDIHTLDV